MPQKNSSALRVTRSEHVPKARSSSAQQAEAFTLVVGLCCLVPNDVAWKDEDVLIVPLDLNLDVQAFCSPLLNDLLASVFPQADTVRYNHDEANPTSEKDDNSADATKLRDKAFQCFIREVN
mmetsp:Transcript_138060/g.240106  ORF Transcript_138060/g.240106 Transcript_138060/m.240106 type:complete len:122 (-) Transcript_138060:53-418(-)